MNRVLLVEDEANFAQVMRDYLVMNGFEVTLAVNGEDALGIFRPGAFDICLLDVMMPKKDGFTLASELRGADRDLPVLFLTARGRREDQLKGYGLGADDYVVKPFDSEVLLMKMRAILRRNGGPRRSDVYRVGKFEFRPSLRTLKAKSGEERLSPKESALLEMLCMRLNEVLPRDKALKQIWKEDNYFTRRSMDVYIAKLRKRFAAEPLVEISSVHGNGYCLRDANRRH